MAFHSSDADVRKSWQRWIVSERSSVRKALFFQREFKAQVLSATCGFDFLRGACSHKCFENHFLPRELEPQVSSSTCGFGFIGVACSERVPCQEIESATKTSMFQGFLVFVMRCKRRYPQPFSSRTFARILNSRSQCFRLWHSILQTLTSGSHGNGGLFLEGQVFHREFKAQVLSATCGFDFLRGACSQKG